MEEPKRHVSRWIAYPALTVIPISCIWLGLQLGDIGLGSPFMIASQVDAPSENWVLSLLTIGIASLTYANWVYENQSFRIHISTVILVIGYTLAMFLFGVWGLYGLTLLGAIWITYIFFRYGRRTKS
jgi:hypothetical protein